MKQPARTIHKSDMRLMDCLHCGDVALHLDGPRGLVCLQCIADSSTCYCSLRSYNRWLDAPAKASR